MSSYVPAALRRLVAARAQSLCEYCLIHESDTYFGCEVEHIISEKHAGATTADNLALACLFCNRSKGSDVASYTSTGTLCRLFHPRTDRWSEHFSLEPDRVSIRPLTDVGEVTVRLLGLNSKERRMEREALRDIGRYPTAAAIVFISAP